MKTLQGISGLSLVAVLMIGCTGKSDIDKAPSPKPSVNTVTIAPSPSKANPVVKAPTQGLIASTEPTAIPIPKGRIDPFSSITAAPIKQTVASGETQRPNTQNPPAAKGNVQNPPAAKGNVQNPTNPKGNVQNPTNPKGNVQNPTNPKGNVPNSQRNNDVSSKNSPIKSTPEQSTLAPVAPSTDLAKAVQVNGVVELGAEVSAIVKEPNEPSRRVSAGDYLGKGKVLVKRIEFKGDREPLITLEQNGVEVIKQVNSGSPVASIQ